MSARDVLAFDEADGKLLIAAADVEVGDQVCFSATFANYLVEEIESAPLGKVRHRTETGGRTCHYDPGELLWVRTPRARRLGSLGRTPKPELPRDPEPAPAAAPADTPAMRALHRELASIAIQLALYPPAKFSDYGLSAVVPRSLITEIRDLLQAHGCDWRAIHKASRKERRNARNARSTTP